MSGCYRDEDRGKTSELELWKLLYMHLAIIFTFPFRSETQRKSLTYQSILCVFFEGVENEL